MRDRLRPHSGDAFAEYERGPPKLLQLPDPDHGSVVCDGCGATTRLLSFDEALRVPGAACGECGALPLRLVHPGRRRAAFHGARAGR